MSETVSPANGCLPVSISYSTTPKAQMSARLSTTAPRACSGAMYAAVPRITPACVADSVSVGEMDGLPCGDRRLQRFRQSEVENLDVAVGGQLHVGRFQIAMDDAFLVRVFQSFGDLLGNRQHFVQRHRPPADPLSQRRPLDQFHDQSANAVALFQSVNGGDVRMVQRREHLRLALEARHALGVVGERLGQDFDRDVAAELGVVRAVDLAHATRADGSEDFVGSQLSPRGKSHGV